MKRKKANKLAVTLLAFLLVFSTVFTNPVFAVGKGEKATSFASKKEKKERTAELQKATDLQKSKALKKLTPKTNSTKETSTKESSKISKQRKSQKEGSKTSVASKSTKKSDTQKKSTLKSTPSVKQKSSKKFVADELIIKFKNQKSATTLKNKHALKTEKKLKSIGAEVVKVKKGSNIENLVKTLKADASVEYVQPNYHYSKSDAPNDPLFDKLWGLQNTGQQINGNPGEVDVDIDSPEAIDEFSNLPNQDEVIVAVIDTGIDLNHPDLKANIWTNTGEVPNNGIDDDGNGFIDDVNGWDFYHYDNTVFDAQDGDEHGTHVAGTIAASRNNSLGVTGIAPNVKIMPLKFLGPEGGSTADAIMAIDYAATMGVKISNNSWGGSEFDPALKEAIERSNMLFVAAAGNDGLDIDQQTEYPAGYDSENIISVAAIDHTGYLAGFSNYGYQNVDIAAPGVDILSTVPKKIERGAAAQISNSTYNFKAIFNGFGFENIIADDRQMAFQKATDYLGVTTTSKVLLVQDDESDSDFKVNYINVYTNLLDNAGISYTTQNVLTDANGPDLATLNNYDSVIWFTGDAMGVDNPTLTATDLSTLDQYLKSGNKSLIISGQDALFRNESTPFVQETLAIDILGEGETTVSANGVAGTIYEGSIYQLTYPPYADYISSNDPSVSTINLIFPGESSYEYSYEYFNGTSMATPHVAGVAALLATKFPDYSATKLKNIIMATGDSIPSLDYMTQSGKSVNALNALTFNPDNLDNDVPGVLFEGDSVEGSVDVSSDTDDVYAVNLNAGETIKATLTGDIGTDFDLYLFSPWATSVNSSTEMLAYSENVDSSTESFEYVATDSGTYYLNVYAYAGSGNYKLTITKGNGVGTYENDSPAINYYGSWTEVSNTSHSGGTAHQLNYYDGLGFSFVGNEIEWVGFKDRNQGFAEIYIDGKFMGEVSLYSDTFSAQQSLFKKTLSYGEHYLNINWTGKRDPRARKSGTAINVDKLIVSETITPPEVPTNVLVFFNGEYPEVTWNDSVTASGYKVYRREAGTESYSLLNSNPISGYSYFYDTTAEPGKTYEYAVSSLGYKDMESDKTAPVKYIYDDKLPGVKVDSTSITGNVNSDTDYMDIIAVNLEAGKTYNFSFNGPTDIDFDYRIFGPGTTDIYYDAGLRELYSLSSEEYVTLPVETAGTYYIVVNALDGSGDYSINIGNKPTVNDDDIPAAVAMTGTEASDFIDQYDQDDVYSVELGKGDTITVNLSSTATNDSDLDVYLYPPIATTIDYNSPDYISEVAFSNQMGSTETFTYTAEAAGKYYIDVNGAYGSGPYDLQIMIEGASSGEQQVTKVDDTNQNITYTGSWYSTSSTMHYNGGAKYTNNAQASVVYTFEGTTIRWIGYKTPYYGLADVYIDDVLFETVDLYASSEAFQQVIFEGINLTNTFHTLKIVVKGQKGNPNAKGSYVNIDGFESVKQVVSAPSTKLIDDTDSSVMYNGTWNSIKGSNHFNETARYTKETGSSVEFKFNGSSIKWIGFKSPYYGAADVYIDGQLDTTVDLYNITEAFQQIIYEKSNLTYTTHSIKIIVKGLKGNSLAKGTYINIDAFEVGY